MRSAWPSGRAFLRLTASLGPAGSASRRTCPRFWSLPWARARLVASTSTHRRLRHAEAEGEHSLRRSVPWPRVRWWITLLGLEALHACSRPQTSPTARPEPRRPLATCCRLGVDLAARDPAEPLRLGLEEWPWSLRQGRFLPRTPGDRQGQSLSLPAQPAQRAADPPDLHFPTGTAPAQCLPHQPDHPRLAALRGGHLLPQYQTRSAEGPA